MLVTKDRNVDFSQESVSVSYPSGACGPEHNF